MSAAAGPEIENRRRVTTAFLLGWALSETLGHLRRGTRRSTKGISAPDYSPRLSVSDGSLEKSADAFLLSANRLVQFYGELGYESPSDASAVTQMVRELPAKLTLWMEGGGEQFLSSHALRDLLNAWSLQVWARLNAESASAARAFSAGISLADTYWYQRPPSRRPKDQELSAENWRRLLSRFRLATIRRRLDTIRQDLPPYVAAVVSRHLDAWSIGEKLGYSDDELALVHRPKQSAPLKPEDETRIQQALERQVQNWSVMLFGLREATTFLTGRDRMRIALVRRLGLFLVLLVTALLLAAVAAYLGLFLSETLFPFLLQALRVKESGVGDWLAVASVLWTVLIAVPVPFILRSVFQGTRTLQSWLHDTLTVRAIARRTFVRWDRYL